MFSNVFFVTTANEYTPTTTSLATSATSQVQVQVLTRRPNSQFQFHFEKTKMVTSRHLICLLLCLLSPFSSNAFVSPVNLPVGHSPLPVPITPSSFSSCQPVTSSSLSSPIATSKTRQQASSSGKDADADVTTTDNPTFREYSRSLTPPQEREQINSEMALTSMPKWKRMRRRSMKPIRKIGNLFLKSIGGDVDEKKPGTLILVRAGESEFSKNYTFAG